MHYMQGCVHPCVGGYGPGEAHCFFLSQNPDRIDMPRIDRATVEIQDRHKHPCTPVLMLLYLQELSVCSVPHPDERALLRCAGQALSIQRERQAAQGVAVSRNELGLPSVIKLNANLRAHRASTQ